MEEPVRPEQPVRRSTLPRRLYSEEEVRGILEQAMGLQDQEFTQDDLVRMAEELGITPAQLEVAEERWQGEQVQRNLAAERRRFSAERRRKFLKELGGWLLCAVLVFLAYRFRFLAAVTTVAAFFLFFGALDLLQTANRIFLQTGDRFERDFDRWLAKQEKHRLQDKGGHRLPES